MVFVCPTKEETEKKTKALCKLKEILNEVQDSLNVPVSPICVPCCVPLCDVQSPPLCPDAAAKGAKQFNPPNVMVCYKIIPKQKKKDKKDKGDKNQTEKDATKVKPSKSRELRASILYRGCDCEQRNGLQDDCPRTGCQGSPECLTRPPTCGPSEFCNGKHLGKKNHASRHGAAASGGAKGAHSEDNARYKCFPAVLKPPVPMCCAPCM